MTKKGHALQRRPKGDLSKCGKLLHKVAYVLYKQNRGLPLTNRWWCTANKAGYFRIARNMNAMVIGRKSFSLGPVSVPPARFKILFSLGEHQKFPRIP